MSRAIEPLERIQRIWIANVEWPEDVGVENREDARAQADAEADGEKHRQRKDWRANDAARGIPYISEEILEWPRATDVAGVFLHQFHVAELEARPCARVVLWQSRRAVLSRLHLEMKVELLGEVDFRLLAPQDGAQMRAHRFEHAHAKRITRPTAAVN